MFANIAFLTLLLPFVSASLGPQFHNYPQWQNVKRQYFPHEPTDMYQFTTAENVTIRYKMPGKYGICETTPDVNSYSGYIDLSPTTHIFFYFFESRRSPSTDDITLFLQGGPGADSLFGLFSEIGPCRITSSLKTILNPYSWNNVSNLLFLSQPVGTGFSYQEIQNGSLGRVTGSFYNVSQASVTGTFPVQDGSIDTTELAAVATWSILQGFLGGLEYLTSSDVSLPKRFNLWTESYGGHYGPTFVRYFGEQNGRIREGSLEGFEVEFKTLGIINGIISEAIQAEYYPEFAINNTYGIQAYNSTVYNYARFSTFMTNGCLDRINICTAAAREVNGGFTNGRITSLASREPGIAALCAEAACMCRDNVEGPFYAYSNRGAYDIRHPANDPTPPNDLLLKFLNQGFVQEALGVGVNWTENNVEVYYAFQQTGDYIYPNFLEDLAEVVDGGVRVALVYGDADYICNWFGGEAVSEQLPYSLLEQFNAAGYQALMYGGVEYGSVREVGNFSFTRIYESGHSVPYYQPQAAFALFDRMISLVDLPTGEQALTPSLSSDGSAEATHTEPFPTLPPTEWSAYVEWALSERASIAELDLLPVPTGVPREE